MLSDKLVQVDILYEYAEYYRKHTIDAEDYETAVKLTQESVSYTHLTLPTTPYV